MKKILIIPLFAIFISILSFLPQEAHATVSYELTSTNSNGACEAIGGTWNVNDCFLSTNLTLNSGDSLTIDSGAFLGLDDDTIDNHGTISNSGEIDMGCLGSTCGSRVIIANDGTINNEPSGKIYNIFGEIDNSGTQQ